MDVRKEKAKIGIYIPPELHERLSPNQRKLIMALARHPSGLLSDELARTGVSNKSETINTKEDKEFLAEYGLEIDIRDIPGTNKSLWQLLVKPHNFKVGDEAWYFDFPCTGHDIRDVAILCKIIKHEWQLNESFLVDAYHSVDEALEEMKDCLMELGIEKPVYE